MALKKSLSLYPLNLIFLDNASARETFLEVKLFRFQNYLPATILFCCLIILWQILCGSGSISASMLPSPLSIAANLCEKSQVYLSACAVTLYEATLGLCIGVVVGFLAACLMERFLLIRRALLPLLSITQAIPIIAIAPIIVLLLGFGALPKIVLVALMTFFPIAISCTGGLIEVPRETVDMSLSCGASRLRTLLCVKIPHVAHTFFSSLKISVTYAFSAAVISEWLGGSGGVGVLMTRAKKSFDYTSLFSCVVLIVLITLLMVGIVNIIERETCRWDLK